MQRRTRSQNVERFLIPRAKHEAQPLRDSIARWASAYHGAIAKAYIKLLDTDLEFLSDRDADLWLPLFAVCAVATPEKIDDFRKCATALSQAKAEGDVDDSLPIKLLGDIRDIWPDGRDRCDTVTLIEKLKDLEESPWGEINLTPRKMARMLRPFEIEPRLMRVNAEFRGRGYERRELEAAFSRYVDVQSVTDVTSQ